MAFGVGRRSEDVEDSEEEEEEERPEIELEFSRRGEIDDPGCAFEIIPTEGERGRPAKIEIEMCTVVQLTNISGWD